MVRLLGGGQTQKSDGRVRSADLDDMPPPCGLSGGHQDAEDDYDDQDLEQRETPAEA
jgi:hypothetical protein